MFTGPPSNGDNTNIHVNVPHMIYKLLEKVFVFTMLGHASDEANQPLYGLLHSALKHECFSECQKSNMKSWIDKLGKVYENVTQPKPFDKRRLVNWRIQRCLDFIMITDCKTKFNCNCKKF